MFTNLLILFIAVVGYSSAITAPSKYKHKCVELVYNGDGTKISKVIHCPTITPEQRKTCHILPPESGNYPKCCERIKNCPNPKGKPKPVASSTETDTSIIPPAKYAHACVELEYDSSGKHIEKVKNCPKITPEQRKNCVITPKITGIYPLCCDRIKTCRKVNKRGNISLPAKYKNQCVELVYNLSQTKISKVIRCPTITDKQRRTCEIIPKVSGDYPKCCDRIKSCPKS